MREVERFKMETAQMLMTVFEKNEELRAAEYKGSEER